MLTANDMKYARLFLLLVLCSCSTASRLSKDASGKDGYSPVMGAVTTIQTTVPEVSGLSAAPAGDGMLAASDESGVYHVSWTGATTEFFKNHMDCEGVTIDPVTHDVYFIVEWAQEVRRLRAPEYDTSELLGIITEAGLGTNDGLEGITCYKDGCLWVGDDTTSRIYKIQFEGL